MVINKEKIKKIILRQSKPETANYTNTKSTCPVCKKLAPHTTKIDKSIPKHFQTYYCKKCAILFHSTQCVHIIKKPHKVKKRKCQKKKLKKK